MAKQIRKQFITRNRIPRVQIEYPVELYDAEKAIQRPFVCGVMADLSGKPEEPLKPVTEIDRKLSGQIQLIRHRRPI